MSGSLSGTNTTEGGNQFTEIVLGGPLGSTLTRILTAESITPGDAPSYELCKTIFAYHPLGGKMAETPINMAQSQERKISIDAPGGDRLVAAYKQEWARVGGTGTDGSWIGGSEIIKNAKVQSRIFGISTLIMGDRANPDGVGEPVKWEELAERDIYFSIFDPLITAGSLILDQNPNSPNYQKPQQVRVGSRNYHPSRSVVVINGPPLFIEWTDSAFGFSGRSVYQRALYPMKTFLQSMVTDWLVTVKCGLLIYKRKAPGSVQNNRVAQFFSWVRSQLKGGVTGHVINIGIDEDISSLNFQNLEGPAAFARTNALKDIAMGAEMPAKLLEQEELVEGLAEGTEDAKQIARYIDRIRIEMTPLYAFMDRIVQRRAWSPAFFKTMQKDFPAAYGDMDYNTAFYMWQNNFVAEWPNLLAEPESEAIKVEETRFKSAVAVVEVAAPLIRTSENRAQLLDWLADEVNSRRKLFSVALDLDTDAEAKAEDAPPVVESGGEEGGNGKEPRPIPFGYEA